eukprot:2268382-Amphidinium_carterae.1
MFDMRYSQERFTKLLAYSWQVNPLEKLPGPQTSSPRLKEHRGLSQLVQMLLCTSASSGLTRKSDLTKCYSRQQNRAAADQGKASANRDTPHLKSVHCTHTHTRALTALRFSSEVSDGMQQTVRTHRSRSPSYWQAQSPPYQLDNLDGLEKEHQTHHLQTPMLCYCLCVLIDNNARTGESQSEPIRMQKDHTT